MSRSHLDVFRRARAGFVRPGLRARVAALITVLCALVGQGCTDRTSTQVQVVAIEIAPPTVTLVVGEDVRLVATVVDEAGERLFGAKPTWSTDDPSVAVVDSSGVVVGMHEGSALVSASFGGALGSSAVRVVPGPGIEITQHAVEMYAGAGGAPPEPQVVHVTNSGTGTLSGLDIDVAYASEGPLWLGAEIAATSAPTSLTLTATVDDLEVGVRTATVMIASSLADVAPVELPVTLTITGFSVEQTGDATVVSEAGTSDTLAVVLESPPNDDVVLTVTSADVGEAVVSPSTLTFTPDDWSEAQVVTVTGVDDFSDDGDTVTTITLAVVAEASDDAFDGIPAQTVDVETTDDDEAPGLTVTESGDTGVGEDGSTDTFTVALTTRPATDVVLTVTSGDPGEVRLSPSTLTFTTSSWNVAQTVTVAGVDDFADDGDQVTTITISVVAVASDDAFDGIPARTVRVTTADDDEPAGMTIEETGGTRVHEDGGTDSFTVALTTQPATDVLLTVTSGDTGEVIVTPATLTFTSETWSVPQTVTVTGVDDLIEDGDQVTAITVAVVAEASDNAFDGVPAQTVSVTTTDDDPT